jgi:uncharacterized membrane protein
MEGIIFLIIASFLFAVIGVLFLLVRTFRQERLLREYGRRIALLESAGKPPAAGAAETAGETLASRELTESMGPAEAGASALPEPEPVLVEADVPSENPAAESVAAEKAVPAERPRAEASFGPGYSLAAFIRGGNIWAAGGIILLLTGFATLITYLASRGFFTVEMGIVGSALSGLLMLALGWRFRKKRPVYFLLLQGGGIGVLYLSIFAAHKLTPYFPPLLSLVLMSLLIPPALILALFQGSQALALLGFLGGFAAPLLLAVGGGNHVFLFAYYGILDLGILAISLFRYWKGINLLAFLCTFILANYWAAVYYQPGLFWQVEPFFLGYIGVFTFLGLCRVSRGKPQKAAGEAIFYPPDSQAALAPAAPDNRNSRAAGGAKTHTCNGLPGIHGLGKGNVRSFDLVLLLGTPALGALLQWRVFDSVRHGHALICVIFSAFYIFLAFVIWKRRGGELRIFSEAYLGFAALLVNLAIPLELSPRISGAVWAAEGIIIFFFGLRLNRFRILVSGLVFHIAAATAFAFEWDPFLAGEGVPGPQFVGALMVALSALAIIFFADHSPGSSKIRRTYPVFPVLMGIWAFCWWFGGWTYEIYRVCQSPQAILFLVCAASALAAFGASALLHCPAYRIGAIPSPALGLFLLLRTFFARYLSYRPELILSYNFFQGLFGWGWLAFFVFQAALLFLSRKDLSEKIHGLWLLIDVFISLGVLSSSGRALSLSRGLAPAWTSLAGMVPVFAAMIVIVLALRSGREAPPGSLVPSPGMAGFHRKVIFFTLPLILGCVMGLWFTVTLFLPGDPAPLPFYIPIVNPLDLEEAFCLVLFLLWQSALMKQKDLPRMRNPALFVLADTAVFLFVIAIIARAVHFYGQVPYRRLFDSGVFHLCLFISWAFYGIAHIIGGSRLSIREIWIAGVVLMAVDIAKFLLLDLAGAGALTRIVSFFIAGLLLLFVGWAAPLPPAAGRKTALPEGGNHEK